MRKEELFDLVSDCATLEIFVAKAAKLVQNPIWIMDDASTTAIHPDVLQTYKSLLDKYYVNSESLYDEVLIYNRKEGK